jgi:Domain of unknown function (DUF4272)
MRGRILGGTLEPLEIKVESERIIKALGGEICDWLPWLDRTNPRESTEVADRALVLHAMLQIYFGAPVHVIASWIKTNRLEVSLSRQDRSTLNKQLSELTEQERTNIYWYIEALWAMVWAGQLVENLAVDQSVGDNLASLLPNLQLKEDASSFRRRFALRPFEQIYRMLDLYFRAHWYARNGHLNGYSTEPFNLDVIMERRRALEWISDGTISDWEETPEDT